MTYVGTFRVYSSAPSGYGSGKYGRKTRIYKCENGSYYMKGKHSYRTDVVGYTKLVKMMNGFYIKSFGEYQNW